MHALRLPTHYEAGLEARLFFFDDVQSTCLSLSLGEGLRQSHGMDKMSLLKAKYTAVQHQ